MIVNDELEKMWKEVAVACVKVLFHVLFEGDGRNHGTPQSG
jgi:hypothetical protein